jgi:hypothetical protein
MFLRKRGPEDEPLPDDEKVPEPRRPWLRNLWLLPIGWALSLVGIYIDAYSTDYTRLGGLILAGPTFTIIGVFAAVRGYRQSKKRR